MFIRAKKVKNRVYYYIVESVRDGDKIKQKNIFYLGTAKSVLKKLKSSRKN